LRGETLEMKPHTLLPLSAILSLTSLSALASPDVALIGIPVVAQSVTYAGGPVQVTYTVKNIGDQAAGASTTKVQIFTSLGTQYAVADFPEAALAVGAQRTVTRAVTVDNNAWTGVWEASVRLDTFFEIANEFPTANNTSDRGKFNLVAVKPDLKFDGDARPGPCPASNAYGGTVRLAFFIHNDSSVAAPASKTRVEIYDRSHTPVVYEEVNTPAIAANAKIPFVYAYQLPATGTAGSWSVFISLNDLGTVSETGAFNNQSDEVSFTVAAAGSSVAPCPVTPGLVNPRVSGSNMVFDLWGNAGAVLNLSSSTDLVNWTPLTTQTLVNGVNTFTTPRSGVKRYYRAK
jgi:hypothetical protein